VAKLRAQGGNVVQLGEDCVDAEREARSVAEQQGSTYISPYNDWDIMAGAAVCSSGRWRYVVHWWDVMHVAVDAAHTW
jgi:threonine dehydratase